VLAAALVAASAAAAAPKPRVTLITDSVGGALGWDATAAHLFEEGLVARLELGPCRRLASTGCPAAGGVPPSALDLIRARGRALGPNVVIDVGYNDDPHVYAAGIGDVLRALDAAHVQHVFWVTLHSSSGVYAETNQVIRSAAARHENVSVIDFDACAAGHGDWFGGDGVHLTPAGAEGLARCLHDGVLRVLDAQPPPPPPLEVELHVAAGLVPGFRAQLVASGGTAPYRFTALALPPGLHADVRGEVTGTIRRSGELRLRVRVRDARGRTATVVVG
jgi:hypothetical protein